MKETKIKKLSLTKETVSNLNEDDLAKVKGGHVSVTMDCQPTWQDSCLPQNCSTRVNC